MNTKISSMPDENLYNLCRQYGERTRTWRQRFAGLLPEVFKRKLYEKKGFISIFEFSKKLAGMSEEQTRLVLNLEKRFEEMPKLKSLLTDGKVSINKLSRIVSIAKPENEIFLANQVQVLSKSAVETLVRDEKQNGLRKSFFVSKSLPGQMQNDMKNTKSNNGNFKNIFESTTLNLDHEVQEKLLSLQQKGIDINELLKEFLQKREEEIAQKKEEICEKILENQEEKPATRHIPISIKRILFAEHGTKCSIKNCQKPSTQIHHIQRFSAVKSHDPGYLAPLCKEHHELEHSADIDYVEIRKRACQ